MDPAEASQNEQNRTEKKEYVVMAPGVEKCGSWDIVGGEGYEQADHQTALKAHFSLLGRGSVLGQVAKLARECQHMGA